MFILIAYTPWAVLAYTSNPESSWGILQGVVAAPGLILYFLLSGGMLKFPDYPSPEYYRLLTSALFITAFFYALVGGIIAYSVSRLFRNISQRENIKIRSIRMVVITGVLYGISIAVDAIEQYFRFDILRYLPSVTSLIFFILLYLCFAYSIYLLLIWGIHILRIHRGIFISSE